jgi:hypothetical protein
LIQNVVTISIVHDITAKVCEIRAEIPVRTRPAPVSVECIECAAIIMAGTPAEIENDAIAGTGGRIDLAATIGHIQPRETHRCD